MRLLALQDVDRARDRLAQERAALPERAAIERTDGDVRALDAALADLLARRSALADAEHALDLDAASMAARARKVETELYSGHVRVAKELAALQAEMQGFRDRQSAIEERELALLDEIDQLERTIDGRRAEHARLETERSALAGALVAAEGVIDAEVARLGRERERETIALPAAVLAAYEKLRSRDRHAGRVVAELAAGACSGCRMRLPVQIHHQMLAEPEDALLLCVHCGRILLRPAAPGSN